MTALCRDAAIQNFDLRLWMAIEAMNGAPASGHGASVGRKAQRAVPGGWRSDSIEKVRFDCMEGCRQFCYSISTMALITPASGVANVGNFSMSSSSAA